MTIEMSRTMDYFATSDSLFVVITIDLRRHRNPLPPSIDLKRRGYRGMLVYRLTAAYTLFKSIQSIHFSKHPNTSQCHKNTFSSILFCFESSNYLSLPTQSVFRLFGICKTTVTLNSLLCRGLLALGDATSGCEKSSLSFGVPYRSPEL